MKAIKTITISILALGLLAGSAVGVAAQNAVVSGSISEPVGCSVESGPDGDEIERCTGARAEFDDTRLTGDVETDGGVFDGGVFDEASGEEWEGFILDEDVRISNDGGSWSGSRLAVAYGTPEEWNDMGDHTLLVGEGDYAGLTAYLRQVGNGVYDGVILAGWPEEEDEE